MTAPILRARGVYKTYRSGQVVVGALRGVDLDVQAGELIMVMGPSGHGKTTLLNCLSGLDDIDGGTVMIDDFDLHAADDATRTEHRARRMGFVFQSYNLIPVFSAVENVELPLLLLGRRPAAARKMAIAMLDRVGLGDRLANRPGALSGGEQQRVAIARAVVASPAIVWADEPTGNLDAETAASVLDLLLEMHDEGNTLVVVTHDADIGSRGSRVVHLVNGQVAADEALLH
ncbi:MAG: transporter related protein [Acidimicrobiia bacterium]|nr:transporter related protein [Acidimicrobiia bacterium]